MTNIYRAVAALCTVGALVAFSASPALAHRGRVFGPSFGGPGSGAGQLSLASFPNGTGVAGGSGLGVSEVTHNVYAADTGNNRIDEFTSAGVFVRAWGWGVQNGASEPQVCTEVTGCRAGLSGTAPGQFDRPAFVVVDNSPGGGEDVYVADFDGQGGEPNGAPLVQKFTAEGVLIESWGSKGQISEENGKPLDGIGGVAVAPTGEFMVGTGGGIFEFNQTSGAYVAEIGESYTKTQQANGIAIDGSGNIYYDQPANLLVGKINIAGGETSTVFRSNYFFSGLAVAQSGELYLDEGNAIQAIAPSCVSLCTPDVTFSSPLLTDGAGLAVDSQSEVVYIAEVVGDKIESIVPEPPAAPLVEAGSESVADVSGDSAILEAAINPRSEPNEQPTSYRFQYTTEEQFQREDFKGADSIPAPEGQLSPNYEADLVTARLQNLLPGTIYHYRVVAENEISRQEEKLAEGERDGAGKEIIRTFTTQGTGVFSLSDGRAWELVSPPNKHGTLIGYSVGRATEVQASPDGDVFTYLANAPTEGPAPSNSNATQVLSSRLAGSWGSRDISTPLEVADGLSNLETYHYFFSSDLSLAIVEPKGPFSPSLSAEASENTPYLRTNYSEGNREDPCISRCYRPLVTGESGVANVPEGTEFGERQTAECLKIHCSPVFLGASPDGSHVVLTSRVPLAEGAPAESLYEWAEGRLELISILPEDQGDAPVSGGLGSQNAVGWVEAHRNAISTDGSHVVWSAGTGLQERLYVRDVGLGETVLLGADAEFQTASKDDSRIFFTKGGDLYVFEAAPGGALSAGHITDIAPGAEVVGAVPGASADDSSIYFVANGVLSNVANAHGEKPVHGSCTSLTGVVQGGRSVCNFYVWRNSEIRFVAVLSGGEDNPDWASTKLATSRVSPDGNWLAFMSARSLTGYDNRDVTSGVPDEEVFLYDATGDNGEGSLVCASCNPTGARPHGTHKSGESSITQLLVDGPVLWNKDWLAANIPGWVSAVYQTRYLSDSGRLFFNSDDALVPSDTNGREDVYEYEPPGVGGCSNGSATFSLRSGGCVDLISSGTSREESVFLDASENGDDVFFLTSAQLSSEDTDTTADVYDARVSGGFPVPQPPPACEGDACQSPVAAPNDPTPGSLTYSGPGNPVSLLTPSKAVTKKALKCSKGKKLSHGRCVKDKSKKKKAAKGHKTADAKKVGKTRRVGS